jgi:hypothetical protein
MMLCAFIAAAHARTPTQRDHIGGQWAKVLEKAERMKEWARTASREQLDAAGSLGRGSGPSLGYEGVKALAETPMQTMLLPQIRAATFLLARLDFALVESQSEERFITSDNPCVWFDPEAYKRPPFYRAPALMYESIELTLPVSPRQMILLNRRGASGYFGAPSHLVDELNRRTRFHCSEHFVNNSNTTRTAWFNPGVEPEDSWEKLHPDSRPNEDPPVGRGDGAA